MAGQGNTKGNPASHRMSNPRLKTRREQSWRNGQARKTARREAQEERHRENVRRHQRGELTPWEQSKAERATRRAGILAKRKH